MGSNGATEAISSSFRALPAVQPYDEGQISRLVATVCRDYASTRRYLVDEGLMRREGGIYELTGVGEAVWRVERFIRDHYLA